jgi:glutamate/tyrosine decarboxylase-like PLP-dependent enzyme
MLALPLWLTMQYVGRERLSSIISRARQLASDLYQQLSSNPSIQLHSSLHSLSVLFRYEPATKPQRLFHTDFLNSLNAQVLIDLSDTASRLHLDQTYLGDRNYVRFAPLSAPECKLRSQKAQS